MRPLPEIRSRTQISSTSTTNLPNGLESHSSDSNSKVTNGVKKEPIVTRSKSVKVLRSGRRSIPSSGGWKKTPVKNYSSDSSGSHSHSSSGSGSASATTNGYLVKNFTSSGTTHNNRVRVGVNGVRKSLKSVTGSPRREEVSTYARHYKSYRRNSTSKSRCRNSVSVSPNNNFASQRSLKLKSTSTSRRLKPYDVRVRSSTIKNIKNIKKSPIASTSKSTSHSASNRSNAKVSRSSSSFRSVRDIRRKINSSRASRDVPKPRGSGSSGLLKPKLKGKPNKLGSSTSSSTSTPLSSPTAKSSTSTSSRDKDGKNQRRSALWVLNCEAEEFLFGETAADKHELELPPSSPNLDSPPPKRRRWRETELSHLLETSPFLESKLRSSSSSPSESGGSGESSNASPPKKKSNLSCKHQNSVGDKLDRRGRPAGKRKSVKIQLSFDSDGDEKESPRKYSNLKNSFKQSKNFKNYKYKPYTTFKNSRSGNHFDDMPRILNTNLELLSPTSSIRSNYSNSAGPASDTKTVLLREVLASLQWKFSFENPPIEESWYRTFSRPDDAIISYKSFFASYLEPNLLPYEMDRPFLRRSRKKVPKNSRKSPRCHASTLAILSSEMPSPSPPRSTRNSISSEVAVSASTSASSTTRVAAASAAIAVPPDASVTSIISINVNTSYKASTNSTTANPNNIASTSTTPNSILSPFTKFVSENSIRITRTRNHSNTNQSQNMNAKRQVQDLSAQQYLWDSIQFLSDPYVVALLAGDQPCVDNDFVQLSLPSSNYISGTATKSSISTRSRHGSRNYCTSAHPSPTINSNSSCPVKKLVQNFEALERKASLRSCDGGSGSGTTSANSSSNNNVPLPKGSPRNHSHGTNSQNQNHVNGTSASVTSSSRLLHLNLNHNGISKFVDDQNRSPTSTTELKVYSNSKQNGKTTSATPNNFHRSRSPPTISTRAKSGPGPGSPPLSRSPVVMVSDIFKNGNVGKSYKKLILEDELLFLKDGLPPLPSWPM